MAEQLLTPLPRSAAGVSLSSLGPGVEAVASPVTVLPSDAGGAWDTRAAARGPYVAYGLRGGQLRVLSLRSGAKALLRGHTGRLADAQFSPAAPADASSQPAQPQLALATIAADGVLLVRRLSEARAHAEGRGRAVAHHPTTPTYTRSPHRSSPPIPAAAPPRRTAPSRRKRCCGSPGYPCVPVAAPSLSNTPLASHARPPIRSPPPASPGRPTGASCRWCRARAC